MPICPYHVAIHPGTHGFLLGAAVASAVAYYLASRKTAVAQAAENVYETKKSVDEYLMMHYGSKDQLCRWEGAVRDALEFPARCAQVASGEAKAHTRALDVGCAVGRASFELARSFDNVVGIDFSHAFVRTAQQLAARGSLEYDMVEEGDIRSTNVAAVDKAIDTSRVSFEQGDATALRDDLGDFDAVIAANLLCRLPDPAKFLARLPSLVRPGGVVVMPSPYTWMEEYTPKDKWIGATYDASGKAVRSIDVIKAALLKDFDLVMDKDFPFYIRETARKNQFTTSHLTVWRRKHN